MGFFVIRNSVAVKGGSVQIGADANIYRSAANVLKTDDALTVVGTLTASGAQVHTGALSQAGSATFSGTPFVVPYETSSPTLGANGDLRLYLKAGIPRLAFQVGGTVYAIALPLTTHGTITITAGSLP